MPPPGRPLLPAATARGPAPASAIQPALCRLGLHAFKAEQVSPGLKAECCVRCGRERARAAEPSPAPRAQSPDRQLAESLLLAQS